MGISIRRLGYVVGFCLANDNWDVNGKKVTHHEVSVVYIKVGKFKGQKT